MSSQGPPPDTVQDPQWSIKRIYWKGQLCSIITQSKNGPCSLIALCNVLLLRGDISITPADRPVASYSYLSELIADYLLSKSATPTDPQLDLGAALSTLPRTQYGLDVDVDFTSHDAFSIAAASNDGAGELALFQLCGVPLVHGWLADPADSETFQAVTHAQTYNRATDLIVRADEIAKGAIVQDKDVGQLAQALKSAQIDPNNPILTSKQLNPGQWSQDETNQVNQALLVQQFLSSTSTQLTYHGLFVLAQSLRPDQLVALFRNSHVSVLYRKPDEPTAAEASRDDTPTLFTLATDSAFLMEDEIVWESLVDVDGGSSEFYDGKFMKAQLRDRDYVGGGQRRDATQPSTASDRNQAEQDADYALAVQLYQEERDRMDEPRPRRHGRRGNDALSPQVADFDENAYVPGPIVPTEVFTTMRYEAEPVAGSLDSSVSHQQLLALVRSLLPIQLQQHLDKRQEQQLNQQSAAKPLPTSSTTPFLTGDEQAIAVPSTNPFLQDMVAASTSDPNPNHIGPDDDVAQHQLALHIPLLSLHLKRLETSADAMCRFYSAAWSATLLKQRRTLDKQEILKVIQDAIAEEVATHGPITGTKGIRVAVTRQGKFNIAMRNVSAFPSSLSSNRVQELAGQPPLPAVRFDTRPTRVRSMDLEPVVFNKTDARGFYELAKQRVGVDPTVLSGVRPEDGRCFDVVLWNDEQTEQEAQTFAQASTGPALITETSIANVLVEYVSSATQEETRFVTPHSSAGMLNGVMHQWLLEHELVQEEKLVVDELKAKLYRGEARLWLCNSLRGVWQVELVENLAVAASATARSAPTGESANALSDNLAKGTQKKKKNRLSQMFSGSSGGSRSASRGGGENRNQAMYDQPNSRKSAGTKDDKCLVM